MTSSRTLRSGLWITAALAVASLMLGAVLTSGRIWESLDAIHRGFAQLPVLRKGHTYLSVLLLASLLVTTVVAWREVVKFVSQLLAGALGCAVVAALLPAFGAGFEDASSVAALHAVLGQAVAGAVLTAVLVSSEWWDGEHATVHMEGGFPLRPLALWSAPMVLAQVSMGALYRHQDWAVIPHMAGAVLVIFMTVGVSVVLLQQVPEHRLLSGCAKATLTVVLVQTVLGISDFLLRLLDFQDTPAWLLLSVAHVSNGMCVIAAAALLGAAVQRCVPAQK